jgi:hypothetical protein
MSPKQRFALVHAPQIKQHLKAIGRKHYALMRQDTEAQLSPEPEAQTRRCSPGRRDGGLERIGGNMRDREGRKPKSSSGSLST